MFVREKTINGYTYCGGFEVRDIIRGKFHGELRLQNHTKIRLLPSVLIESEIRKRPPNNAPNFGFGTLPLSRRKREGREAHAPADRRRDGHGGGVVGGRARHHRRPTMGGFANVPTTSFDQVMHGPWPLSFSLFLGPAAPWPSRPSPPVPCGRTRGVPRPSALRLCRPGDPPCPASGP